ncbi:leucine-rich repeat, cysteine-containing subtype protein, partial [Tanacetum coccineum]
MEELVLDCVIPYIQDNNDLNSVSLVSRKYLDNDSLTRKHLTVHVHFAPDSKRVSHRFPNLESLTLKSYSYGQNTAHKCSISVFPWILEIAVNFKRLKSLSIRNMVVSAFDLQLLAKTRGANLRSLEIRGCKMFSREGLIDIARDCKDLRNLRLENNETPGFSNGKWLHELALCNTVMESFDVNFIHPFYWYDIKDVTLLANKCSESLVSLNISAGRYLDEFGEVFNHAKKLNHFGYGVIRYSWDYSDFKLPLNIRGLRIENLREEQFSFLLPYLSQLRELYLDCGDIKQNCQCFLFERCPSLEVLVTDDICGDIGLQVIGQFCKNLRKFTHHRDVTQMGLIALAQGCPNLEYLRVILSNISNEALECVGTHLKNLRDFRNFRVKGSTLSPL